MGWEKAKVGVVFAGEQPGDQEDIAGNRLFVQQALSLIAPYRRL
jgi:hypothetical protein